MRFLGRWDGHSCLAMAPVLADGCSRRGLNPVPFLLALACAANVGSAATLIGNPLAGPILALSSTLAGNLLIVGSIANIIVVDQASHVGLTITWRDHARVGIPVTVLTLCIAAVWLLFLAG